MSDRKYTIYAVDFDGTLCESVWPGIGEPNMVLIEHLKKRRRQGNKIILWTCRVGERLQEAVDWCKGYGLEFDAVNENLPEMIQKYGNDSRKIYADCYFEDKSADNSKYNVPYLAGKTVHKELKRAIDEIRKEYEKSFELEYVRDPIGYTLYHVWKRMEHLYGKIKGKER